MTTTNASQTNRARFILLVDDEPFVLSVAVNILCAAGYECLIARSASQALIILRNPDYIFDLMITDLTMSGMNGIDLMKHAIQLLPDVPVIIMSGASEVQTAVEALRAGAADYLVKPFDQNELVNCVSRTLTKKTLPSIGADDEARNWQTVARAFALALDARDKETEGHAERVVAYSVRLGQELGLSSYDLILVELGARLHDIGKIAVPDHVLKKPAPLTDEEWVQMRLHPAKGQEMVRNMRLPEASALIVGQHHEQWNGSGYPLGLKQEEISIGARIFSVVDTFDAITSDRVYRRGRPYQDALEEILKFSGIQFDPTVVEAFARIEPEEWIALRSKCPSESSSQQHAIAC
jgi:putative nucleotidyltransferase with HDIG domain